MQKRRIFLAAIVVGSLLGLLSFGLSNCKKSCDQDQVADLKFTQDDLKINPYSGNEVLIFKNLSGDSLTLAQCIRNNYPYVIYRIDYEEAKLYHNGCQGDYFNADYNVTTFRTLPNDSITDLSIRLSFLYSFDNPTFKTSITLFFFHGIGISSFDADFEFKNDSLYNLTGNRDSIIAYHDQITIGTKTFSNVYELYSPNHDTRNPEWFKIAYYSITEGYLGFLSNYGQLWYLHRKEK